MEFGTPRNAGQGITEVRQLETGIQFGKRGSFVSKPHLYIQGCCIDSSC